MNNRFFRILCRPVSLVLSFILVFSLAGCSDVSQAPVDTENTDTVSDNDESVPSGNGMIDDGFLIYDFDEYINAEWYSEHAGDKSYLPPMEVKEDYIATIRDILETTDVSTLSEDDGLYKIIMFYREMMDTSDKEARLDSIAEYLAPIEAVKNYNDLFNLYRNMEYARANNAVQIRVVGGAYWLNVAEVDAESNTIALEWQMDLLDDESSDFRYCLNYLGFDDERIEEIYSNSVYISGLIDEYNENIDPEDYYWYYNEEDVDSRECVVPVYDIVKDFDALGDSDYLLARDSVFSFYNELYVPENFEALKDYMLSGAFWTLYLSGYDICANDGWGYDLSYDDYVIMYIMAMASDVISKTYMDMYCDEDTTKELNSLILKIKSSAIKTISDVDWLGDDAKESVKQKMSRMGQYIGQNGHRYFIDDYVLTGDTISDALGLRLCAKKFEMVQAWFSDIDRAPFGMDVMEYNAYYSRYYNCLLVGNVMLFDIINDEDPAIEEQLGHFGVVIAHELGHSCDSYGINFDYEGYYEPIITEEEYDAYIANLDQIEEFFDGMTIYGGHVLDGSMIRDETYADLFSVRVCLNILADMEDPDYDLFFRTYASYYRSYYSENDIDFYLDDTHLLAKERINYILGMFDEFYETYNIDPESPYFVPEDERLRFF